MTKKVLITEPVAGAGVGFLRDKGFRVDVELGASPEKLLAIIPSYDALIVRSGTQVSRQIIKAASQLKIIGRAGVGVDNIDVQAATEHGVIVCNAPTSNIVSVAEMTMALMLICARRVAQANGSMHEGRWERSDFVGAELFEKTLAIVGLGRIGGLVAERARAFGMKLIGYDPYCSSERAEQLGVMLYDKLDTLLPAADFITAHLPQTPETLNMFGANEYARMKDGVILINAAHASLYNLNSLADFLAAGKIGAVGLDVYDEEPCYKSPLHEFDRAILTPHLGASTEEAQLRAGLQTAEYVAAALEGRIVPTALNMAPVPPEVMDAVGPYVPVCQMMGSMLAQMNGEMPKQIQLITHGSLAGIDPSILVAGTLKGILSYKDKTAVTPVNAEAVAKRHGIEVETHSRLEADSFASVVSVAADNTKVACTLGNTAQGGRVVSLLGYKIDIAPAGQSLIFEYEDAPGRIGSIGTILGEANINITTMQIGTKPERQRALVYMNVEGSLDEEILKRLRAAVPGLEGLWHLRL